MVRERVGRLPVVDRQAPRLVVGVIFAQRPAFGAPAATREGQYQVAVTPAAIAERKKALFG